MSKTILLVEDNLQVTTFNTKLLEREGYNVISAPTLAIAKVKVETEHPDIIVLDIGMPDGSGLNFLRKLREYSSIPVLLLTGYSRDEDVVSGFRSGCDDYLAKPYSFDVLSVRILRLINAAQKVTIHKGNLEIDMLMGKAQVNGKNISLSPINFALLKLFAQHAESDLSPSFIYESVWGSPIVDDTRALANAISRLRKKLRGSNYTIVSVYGGGGYRFTAE